MKRVFFNIYFVILSFSSIGQVWIDSGAVWHYDLWNTIYRGFEKYEYVKDTVIENHNCQKIMGVSYKFMRNQNGTYSLLQHHVLESQYTYVSGDIVFYRNHGEFLVLYNFGASIGDNWIISKYNPSGACDDTSRIEVIDTGKIILNSRAYRFITVQPTSNSPFGFKGRFVERFGNLEGNYAQFQYLFPTWYQCDSIPILVEWDWVNFKCFKDNSFTLYNPSGRDCEYYFTHLGIPETMNNNLQCFPNPTSGLLSFGNCSFDDSFIEIYNYQGLLVRSFQVPSATGSIDISDLNSGMYFLKLKSKTKDNCILKIIKE